MDKNIGTHSTIDKNIDNYNGCNTNMHIQSNKMTEANNCSSVMAKFVYIRNGFFFFCKRIREGVRRCWYKYFPRITNCVIRDDKKKNKEIEDITKDITSIEERSYPSQRSPQKTKVTPTQATLPTRAMSSGTELSTVENIPVVENTSIDIAVESGPRDEETGYAKEVINPLITAENYSETNTEQLKLALELTTEFNESLFPMVTDKYTEGELLQNIVVIQNIKPYDKLYYYDNQLAINISYSLTRWWNSQNRYMTVSVVDHIFKEYVAMRMIPDLTDAAIEKLTNENILECISGITNLKQTYADNPDVNAKLAQILIYINEKCLH